MQIFLFERSLISDPQTFFEKVKMNKVDVQVHPSLLKELVVENKIFRSTCDHQVTERDLEKARKELKETDVKRGTCLEELKTMLSRDKRMRYRMDDDYLLRFLRYRKFDVQKAYNFIHNFYTIRNEDPLLFTLPPDAECQFYEKLINMMPYTNENGEMIFLHKAGNWNLSKLSKRDYFTMFSYISDVSSMNPHAQIDGVILIVDFGGITTRHVTECLYLPTLKFWAKVIQESYPWRVKKVIVFNLPVALYAAFYFARSFAKKKISDRAILIRSDLKELHKHVNPEILPKEYGGNLDDEECWSCVKKYVFSNKEYLRYENSFIGYEE